MKIKIYSSLFVYTLATLAFCSCLPAFNFDFSAPNETISMSKDFSPATLVSQLTPQKPRFTASSLLLPTYSLPVTEKFATKTNPLANILPFKKAKFSFLVERKQQEPVFQLPITKHFDLLNPLPRKENTPFTLLFVSKAITNIEKIKIARRVHSLDELLPNQTKAGEELIPFAKKKLPLFVYGKPKIRSLPNQTPRFNPTTISTFSFSTSEEFPSFMYEEEKNISKLQPSSITTFDFETYLIFPPLPYEQEVEIVKAPIVTPSSITTFNSETPHEFSPSLYEECGINHVSEINVAFAEFFAPKGIFDDTLSYDDLIAIGDELEADLKTPVRGQQPEIQVKVDEQLAPEGESYEIEVSPDDFYLNPNLVHVILEPVHKATISAQITSPVLTITKEMGQPFKAGDVLVRLDDAIYNANLEKSIAIYKEAKLNAQMRTQLFEDDIGSLTELKDAQTKFATARAELALARKQVESTVVAAPYAGRVVDIHVQEYELARANEPLIDIIGDEILIARMLVEASQLPNIELNDIIKIHFPEVKITVPAKIIRIGAEIDPASSTIRVDAQLENPNLMLTAGMTGTALLPDKKKGREYKVSPPSSRKTPGLQQPSIHGPSIQVTPTFSRYGIN